MRELIEIALETAKYGLVALALLVGLSRVADAVRHVTINTGLMFSAMRIDGAHRSGIEVWGVQSPADNQPAKAGEAANVR